MTKKQTWDDPSVARSAFAHGHPRCESCHTAERRWMDAVDALDRETRYRKELERRVVEAATLLEKAKRWLDGRRKSGVLVRLALATLQDWSKPHPVENPHE